MGYFSDYAQLQKRSTTWVIYLYLEKCIYEFGVSPCTATGSKCYKTFYTCKDKNIYVAGQKVNYQSESPTYKTICFTSCDVPQPVISGYVVRPYIKSIEGLSQKWKLYGAETGSITIRMLNENDYASELDPYNSERAELPTGTYFSQLLSRYPQLKGSQIKIYQAFIIQNEGGSYGIDGQRLVWQGYIDDINTEGAEVSITAKDIWNLLYETKVMSENKQTLKDNLPDTVIGSWSNYNVNPVLGWGVEIRIDGYIPYTFDTNSNEHLVTDFQYGSQGMVIIETEVFTYVRMYKIGDEIFAPTGIIRYYYLQDYDVTNTGGGNYTLKKKDNVSPFATTIFCPSNNRKQLGTTQIAHSPGEECELLAYNYGNADVVLNWILQNYYFCAGLKSDLINIDDLAYFPSEYVMTPCGQSSKVKDIIIQICAYYGIVPYLARYENASGRQFYQLRFKPFLPNQSTFKVITNHEIVLGSLKISLLNNLAEDEIITRFSAFYKAKDNYLKAKATDTNDDDYYNKIQVVNQIYESKYMYNNIQEKTFHFPHCGYGNPADIYRINGMYLYDYEYLTGLLSYYLRQYQDPRRKIKFKTDLEVGSQIEIMDSLIIDSDLITGVDGLPVISFYLVIQKDIRENDIEIECVEFKRVATIAPDDIDTGNYSTYQKKLYCTIAEDCEMIGNEWGCLIAPDYFKEV